MLQIVSVTWSVQGLIDGEVFLPHYSRSLPIISNIIARFWRYWRSCVPFINREFSPGGSLASEISAVRWQLTVGSRCLSVDPFNQVQIFTPRDSFNLRFSGSQNNNSEGEEPHCSGGAKRTAWQAARRASGYWTVSTETDWAGVPLSPRIWLIIIRINRLRWGLN